MRSNILFYLLPLAAVFGCGTTGLNSSSKSVSRDFAGNPTGIQQASWTEKITAPFKSDGDSKKSSSTASQPENDPISLQFRSGPPSAALYVSMAQMAEQGSNNEHARAMYQKALTLEPKNIDALLGMARLEDRLGNLPTAMQIYQRAASLNPMDPRPLNDLALCHARSGQMQPALQLLHQAVRMKPDKQLYRNNIAKVLIELNRLDLAKAHLEAVYVPAVASYNLGTLLHQRDRTAEATVYLLRALELNPQMPEAQKLLATIQRNSDQQPGAQVSQTDMKMTVSPTQPAPLSVAQVPAGKLRVSQSNDDILPTTMFPPGQITSAPLSDPATAPVSYPSTGAAPLIPSAGLSDSGSGAVQANADQLPLVFPAVR